MHEIPAVTVDAVLSDVLVLLARYPETPAIVVVSELRRPLGLISRRTALEADAMARVAQCMDSKPICVEAGTSVHQVLLLLGRASHEQLAQGFVVTRDGYYAGLTSIQDLLVQLTLVDEPDLKLLSNNPVYYQLQRLLRERATGALARINLSHFAAYNHVFGYQKGDELIHFTWDLLQQICQPGQDKVSHLGGDHFLMLLQSDDWEQRCRQLILLFAQQATRLMSGQRHFAGGYSSTDLQGSTVYHPFPTIAVGVVALADAACETACEVLALAAYAQQGARDKVGNILFIEPKRTKPSVLVS